MIYQYLSLLLLHAWVMVHLLTQIFWLEDQVYQYYLDIQPYLYLAPNYYQAWYLAGIHLGLFYLASIPLDYSDS